MTILPVRKENRSPTPPTRTARVPLWTANNTLVPGTYRITASAGSKVIFTATPAKNYQVWKWTVKSGAQVLTENTDYTLSTDKKTLTVSSLQKKLDVHVEFSNQFYTVSAQSDTHGSVTAAVGDVPVLTSSVLSGTEVTFTAKPSFAMGIAGWQYKIAENGTWINSSVTGLSYTIRNLQSNIWVRALVNDNAKPTTVNFGVVDENGHTVESGTLTAKNGSNTFDSGAKQPAGSTIVFTATPKDGYQVEGWYTAANGSTAITGTASEQNSYTLTNLTNAANVYVAFEKIPTYDITVDTTGPGSCYRDGKRRESGYYGRHIPTECSRHPRAGGSNPVPLRTEQRHRRKRRRVHQHSQLRGCPASKRVRDSRIAVGCRRRRAERQERQPSCPDRHCNSCRDRRNHAALVREDRSKVKPNTPGGMKKEQSMTAPFRLSKKRGFSTVLERIA